MTTKSPTPIKIFPDDFIPNDMTDDERIYAIKEAIQELRPVERKIFLTYVEGGTYTSVAQTYGVSVPTAKKYILQVINKVLDMINDDVDNNK